MLENLFINILEISITSAAAIAVILLISGLSEGRFRKKWRYWVWAFLAVYLIVPFKIDFPDAPIKMEIPPHEMVITQREEPPKYIVPEDSQSESTVLPVVPNVPETDNSENENPVMNEAPVLESQPKIYVYPVVYVAAVIWAVGAVTVCGWNIAMYLRFVTRSKPWNREIEDEEVLRLFEDIKAEMGISRRVKIYENRLIKSPMMVGYIRPRVLLPAEALLPEEYEFVLRHELTHCKRGDIWYKFLMMLAASIHWFNPMVGRMCHYADSDMEITCDAAVVKAMAGDRRQEYCATILNIMRRGQNSPLLLSTSFYGGAKILKKRFSAVLEPRAHRGIALFIIAVLVIIISGTMVACGTAEVPEEPAIDEPAEEQLSAEEMAAEKTGELLKTIYIEKRNEYADDDAFANMSFSGNAEQMIEDIRSGRTDLFTGNEKKGLQGTTLSYDIKEQIVIGNIVETVYDVAFHYYSEEDSIGKNTSYVLKITYDVENDEFTEILLKGFNWQLETVPADDKPEVTGPDENGKFPKIASADWDRWINYEGEADTVKPTEEIPSILENERMMENLKKKYPDIDDWEVIYEKKDYVLKNTYDPYTYSFRNMYLPTWFVLFETEQSEEFDRLFVNGGKDYSVIAEIDENENISHIPAESYYNSMVEAFEKDIKAGNMKNSVTMSSHDFPELVSGIWFPNENRMIFFDSDMEARAIEGINEPLYIRRTHNAFGGGRRDFSGATLEAPSGRENDLFLEIDISPEKNLEKGSLAYYDYETKTVDIYENCVAEGLFEYPQIYYIDSEIMFIESDGYFSFYKTAPHNIITEAFAGFGGNGNGLCEGDIGEVYYLGIDKTKGGRYMFFYTDEEKEEYSICTFDRNGKILSNFSTGLDFDGKLASVSYKSGVVYFIYQPDPENPHEEIKYAVDARPNGKQELQANAW